MQNLSKRRARDAIADAQTGQPLNFRKRAQHGDVAAFADETERVRWIVEVFEIRFIENDDDVLRDALDESIDLLLAGQRASGIVWVRDEDEARLRRDGRNHGVKVMPQIGAW